MLTDTLGEGGGQDRWREAGLRRVRAETVKGMERNGEERDLRKEGAGVCKEVGGWGGGIDFQWSTDVQP